MRGTRLRNEFRLRMAWLGSRRMSGLHSSLTYTNRLGHCPSRRTRVSPVLLRGTGRGSKGPSGGPRASLCPHASGPNAYISATAALFVFLHFPPERSPFTEFCSRDRSLSSHLQSLYLVPTFDMAPAKGSRGYQIKTSYPLTEAMKDTSKPTSQHVEGGPAPAATTAPGPPLSEKPGIAHAEHDLGRKDSHKPELNSNANARLANPLGGLTDEEVMHNAAEFAKANNLPVEDFRKGALVAKHPLRYEMISQLDEKDRESLRREVTHPYHQPKVLYHLVVGEY